MQVFPEPVEKWQKLGGTEVNLLDAFYKDPPRYAYTFQNYVFLTRVEQVCPLCCNSYVHAYMHACVFGFVGSSWTGHDPSTAELLTAIQIALMHAWRCSAKCMCGGIPDRDFQSKQILSI